MSSLLNWIMESVLPFKKNLGMTAEPIRNAINAIAIVIVRLVVSEFKDSSKNIEKRKMTISGLKIWFFRILFLFKNDKKSASGYNPLK
jgi:hypothetical protein